MTDDQLEAVVAETGHDRYRWLVSDENPDAWLRESSRAEVVRLAGGSTSYPSLATQAANVIGAAARFVGSGFATVDQPEFDRRHAICEACPHFDADQDRCRKCGCFTQVKLWGAREHCPDDPPRW